MRLLDYLRLAVRPCGDVLARLLQYELPVIPLRRELLEPSGELLHKRMERWLFPRLHHPMPLLQVR